jgi:hypothetical protein
VNQIIIALLAVLLGCVLRTLLPYVVKGFQLLQENNPWPKFEYSYLGSLGLAVVGYGLMFLIKPDYFSQIVTLPFTEIVALAYAGQESARQVIKIASVLYRFSQKKK